MHAHVRVCKVRELQLEYSPMHCSEHEADVKGHRIVQKSTKMPKTAAKKSAKKNPKKTEKSVTTKRRVTHDRRTPQNTRRQEVVEPVRKRTWRDIDNPDAVPPKQPRSSDNTEDGHSEDDPSDSVSNLGDSGGELLTDEDLSGKNVVRTCDVEQL